MQAMLMLTLTQKHALIFPAHWHGIAILIGMQKGFLAVDNLMRFCDACIQIVLTVVEKHERPNIDWDHLPGDKPASNNMADYAALMQKCWAQTPAARPTFEHINENLRSAELLILCMLFMTTVPIPALPGHCNADTTLITCLGEPGLAHRMSLYQVDTSD